MGSLLGRRSQQDSSRGREWEIRLCPRTPPPPPPSPVTLRGVPRCAESWCPACRFWALVDDSGDVDSQHLRLVRELLPDKVLREVLDTSGRGEGWTGGAE